MSVEKTNPPSAAVIKKITAAAAVLPVIYIILSLVNIYNVNISISVFHDTYEKWKDTTWFTSLHPYQIKCYIFSVIFILPYIAVCFASIFSEILKGKKKLTFSAAFFLIFLFFHNISQDEVIQTTCSDDFVKIGLVTKLQNIFMLLNIISLLLVICTSFIEIHAAGKKNLKKL